MLLVLSKQPHGLSRLDGRHGKKPRPPPYVPEAQSQQGGRGLGPCAFNDLRTNVDLREAIFNGRTEVRARLVCHGEYIGNSDTYSPIKKPQYCSLDAIFHDIVARTGEHYGEIMLLVGIVKRGIAWTLGLSIGRDNAPASNLLRGINAS